MKKWLKRTGSGLMALAVLSGDGTALLPQMVENMTVNAASVSDKESNDTMPTAQTINIGDTVSASLSESDYQDYFKFTLSSSGRLSFDITSYMPVLNFILYDSDGNELYKRWENYESWGPYKNAGNSFQWNSVSQKTSESISWDLTAGTYYFRFQFRELDLAAGLYNFTTKFTSTGETYKESGWGVNNTMQTASTANFGKHYIGQIARNDEYDFYKVTLPSSGRLTTNVSGSIEYLNYRLYDSDGNDLYSRWENYESWGPYKNAGSSLHWNDVSKKMEDSFYIDVTKGVYYICLKRNGGNVYCTGNYDIMFSFESANESFTETGWGINNSMEDASIAQLNTVYTGQISRNDEYDFYQIVMPSAGTLNTNVNGRIAYLNYRLYDEKGNEKESRWENYESWGPYKNAGNSFHWNDNSKNFDETVSTELEAGTYYACLKRIGNNVYGTGTYDIAFNSDVVVSPISITLDKTSASLKKGDSLTLTATISPKNATDKTITWSSSNTSVATVSGGVVTAKEAGTAIITAKTYNGKTATCTVTVVAPAELKNSSTVSATSVAANTEVTMNGKASGGTEPYKFAYYYKKSTDSTWTKAYETASGSAYTKNTSVTFKPTTAGTYNVKINVKDNNGTGTLAAKEFTLTVKAALKNSSTISATNVTANTEVTLNGKASGGTSPYKFAYYYKKSTDSSYTKAYVTASGSAYTKNTSVTFKPPSAGTYNVKINVKDNNGTGTVVSKEFTLTVKAASTALKNCSTISSTSVTANTEVTLNGKASGGTSPYKYAYYYKKSSDSAWTKAYVTSSGSAYTKYDSVTFKPTSAGTYNVKINVKDQYGEGQMVSKEFTLTVKAASSGLKNSSTISATTTSVNNTLVLTGKASGGNSPYTYAYYYKKSTETDWKKIVMINGSAYSSITTVTFTPDSKGKYDVRINVKDSSGSLAQKGFTVTVT